MKLALIALLFAGNAQAYMNTTTTRIGDTTYSNTYGSDGHTMNTTTQKIGNTIYSSGFDNKGNTAHCTTQVIGDQTYTNCY